MTELQTILFAFFLTLIAGLSTGIGSFIAFFTKRTSTKFLSVALGFSAGVMIYVSFVEIFFEAKRSLVAALGDVRGNWITIMAFFTGMLVIALIDKLVPSYENPHELRSVEEIDKTSNVKYKNNKKLDTKKLMRTGVYTALAIAIHNFPEGIATFTAAYKDISLGIAITIAIALHNIPEGIAIAVPIYYATGDKKKALKFSFLSGFAEPLGAIIAYVILLPFLNDVVFGILFASVAGIMVFIALDELLPASREYGEPHLSVYGLVLGMAVMAVGLQLFI